MFFICNPASPRCCSWCRYPAGVALAADDLVPLSDEFNDASTLSNWQRVYLVEGWNANQLELQDINTSQAGRMVMMPHTSTWYQDYRGELTFKTVQGDFVVTTDVVASQRGGTGPPSSQFSLGGIMLRAPRAITPATWQPGGENYLFLSIGAASVVSTFQFEVKSTTNSNSVLYIVPAPSGHSAIQWARVGPYFIALQNSGGSWVVHRRYYRPDLPAILQVGMTTYTDYPYCAANYTPLQHNSTVISGGNPDLVAAFDYFRYERPIVPPSLVGANLSDPNAVSDSALLGFLGGNAIANAPAITDQPSDVSAPRGATATFSVTATGQDPLSYQWRKNGMSIVGATSRTLMLSNIQSSDAGLYSVVVTNAVGSATSGDARLTVTVPAPASIIATAASASSVAVSWSTVSGAASYEVARSTNGTTFTTIGSTTGTSLTDSGATANTAYLYEVRALDAGSLAGPYSGTDLATTVIFTDDPLTPGVTVINAAHITELRAAVNAVRALAGLGVGSFTDPTITAGMTTVKAAHVSELRMNLDAARYLLGLSALSYADGTLIAGSTGITAVQFLELRNGVR